MNTKERVKKAATTAAKALGSQQAIADIAHVDKSAVTHWMRGENCSLENYFKLLEIAKKVRTPAAIVLAILTAASASIFGSASDVNASETQTADKNAPAVVYYVKYFKPMINQVPIFLRPPS